MTAPEKLVETRPEDNRPQSGPATLSDARFRTLVGEQAWARLPDPVRRRFTKRLAPGEALIYRGTVIATELSLAGRALAFFARAIGSPLPLTDGATGPALVAVVEDERLGGQSWTRMYARPGRFPQTIHSAKRFLGPTGLEEYVGYGIGMALRVTVEDGALVSVPTTTSSGSAPGAGVYRNFSSPAAWRSPTARKETARSRSG